MKKWMNQGTTYCYDDIFRDIELCAKYGFKAIELKYNRVRFLDINILNSYLQNLDVLAGVLGAFELPIFIFEDEKKAYDEKFISMCQVARILNAEYILVNICGKNYLRSYDEICSQALEELGKYADIAKIYGVKLALEITGYYGFITFHTGDGIKMIDQLDRDNLQLVIDMHHIMGMNEGIDILSSIDVSKIAVVHLSDGISNETGYYTDNGRLWPGDGCYNLDKVIDCLWKKEYSGPLSMEVFKEGGWEFDIETCYQIADSKFMTLMRNRDDSGLA